MTKIIWIFVLFLGLPAGIYFLLGQALSTQEVEWSQAVLKDFPSEAQQQFSLSSLCYNPQIVQKVDLSTVCRPYRNTRRLRGIALGAAVTPILYSLILIGLSLHSRKNRTLLLNLFRPGIYISTFLVAILILLQWLLISGLFYGYEFGQITNDDYFWIVLLGIIAIIGAFLTIRPIITGVPRAQTTVLGLQLNENEYPTIWNFIRDLAAKADAQPPDHLVVGFTPNFFVTEATVDCISGTLEGATLYLSLPLCRILNTHELSAVVLHELSHFKGEDAKFSIRFYPIYRGISDSLNGVANASTQFAKIGSYIPIAGFRLIFIIASLSLLPSVYLLKLFLDSFSHAENHIGRERELSADALAARIQGSESIASVLVKLAAFSGIWGDVTNWANEAQVEGVVKLGEETYEPRRFFFNMSKIFCAMAQNSAAPDRLQNLDLVKLPHPTDTHPPLSVRLKALNTSLTATCHIALSVALKNPASDLIDNVETLEINLSEIQQRLMTA